ncbi:MAG: GNAT family N-acetyltransferase [Anaerolineaceae bacterium]|nr:GNAT family N-acetyltransferase [Anaerolineaceae bacterium]
MTSPYTLRPVTQADYEFLYDLNRRTMRVYVEPLWGWDEAVQRENFQQRFKLDDHFIIVVDGTNAGRLSVDRSAERIFLSQINLLPDFQGKGIGSNLIESLKAEAAQANQPLELRVLQTNRPARRLYTRLGFVVFDENDTHLWMRWQAGIVTDG